MSKFVMFDECGIKCVDLFAAIVVGVIDFVVVGAVVFIISSIVVVAFDTGDGDLLDVVWIVGAVVVSAGVKSLHLGRVQMTSSGYTPDPESFDAHIH